MILGTIGIEAGARLTFTEASRERMSSTILSGALPGLWTA